MTSIKHLQARAFATALRVNKGKWAQVLEVKKTNEGFTNRR